jgi:putative oxidoreductase
VNNKYEKTLKGITSLSFIGWALFVVLTKEEIVSAIEYFLPLSLKQSKGTFFFLFIGLFFLLGVLVFVVKKWKDFSSFVLRIILAFTFLLAAIPKIIDPAGFALDISHYDIFPKIIINVMAITVPWVEMLVAISILFYVFDKGGILLVNLMLFAFLVLLGQALVRGLDIDCGCFGHSGAREAVSKAFLRDLFFVSWSILLYLFTKNGDKKV